MTNSTATATELLTVAIGKARELNSRIVGQEHVLLALAERPDSFGAELLVELGLGSGISVLEMWITPGATAEPNPAPTVRLVKAVEEADAEARESGRPATSADLVIGIVRAGIGVGYQLLRAAGVTLAEARSGLEKVTRPDGELASVVDSSLAAALAALSRD